MTTCSFPGTKEDCEKNFVLQLQSAIWSWRSR